MSTSKERSPWPAVRYEGRPWRTVQAEYGSRAPMSLASDPYLASVPAFIADLQWPLDSELQALTEEAASELA
ncbi:hypothetical protein [Cryobacterium sp. MLB-32]|uniref:hypothetical protein n=1 Tax=Cryobacterium sp. MLB-32 TaxID=1529318 RepID=UPI001E35EAD2|nr:hypothetical protein [Cryobacterium sp. MLB-32]